MNGIKREFCLPCFLDLRKVRDVKPLPGKARKITCWKCKRRRFGKEYEVGEPRKDVKP